ncbi:PREDICTED: atypical chemokine receptor 1 [Charadrius vociferus]|uniref:atypical chemokine receptor 1 n=1 Tax=Charadrius vociferus TaxID=50402 RepID=UPI000521B4A9|nr:PREDICTED: atypical chemokine receptor 1 [Charadrius vociferus]
MPWDVGTCGQLGTSLSDAHWSPLQSPSVLESENSLDLLDILGNLSYDDSNMTFLDYDAAPCHNQYCRIFQHVAPAFLAVTCAAASLGTGALLGALAKRPHAWGWPQSRALVAQLAVGMGLFPALLPPVAVGIGQGGRLGTGLCRGTHLLWHWSLFAQGLLVGSGSCSTVWCRWAPRSRRLAVAIWAGALLLATPAALTSGTVAAPEMPCIRRSVDVRSPAYLLHLVLCLCLFLLLPAVLLVATLAVPRLRAGWEPGMGTSWLFFGLWVPYGMGLAVDFLLQARLLQPTCGTFEHFDYVLGLSEGQGVLHCCLGRAPAAAEGPVLATGTPTPSTIPAPHSVHHQPRSSCPTGSATPGPNGGRRGHQAWCLSSPVPFLGVSAPLFGARHPDLLSGDSPGVLQASPQDPSGCQPQAPARLWGPPRLGPSPPSSTGRFQQADSAAVM